MNKCKNPFNILSDKPIGKRLPGRPGFRYEDDVIIDPKEIDVNTSNLIDSTQDRDY